MAPEINWGWSASNKVDELEKRVAQLEKVVEILVKESPNYKNSNVYRQAHPDKFPINY